MRKSWRTIKQIYRILCFDGVLNVQNVEHVGGLVAVDWLLCSLFSKLDLLSWVRTGYSSTWVRTGYRAAHNLSNTFWQLRQWSECLIRVYLHMLTLTNLLNVGLTVQRHVFTPCIEGNTRCAVNKFFCCIQAVLWSTSFGMRRQNAYGRWTKSTSSCLRPSFSRSNCQNLTLYNCPEMARLRNVIFYLHL